MMRLWASGHDRKPQLAKACLSLVAEVIVGEVIFGVGQALCQISLHKGGCFHWDGLGV